jgi:hypothetical protein
MAKMKKECYGCRAYSCRCGKTGESDAKCNLGYKITSFQKDVSIGQKGTIMITCYKPDEECPKPKTWEKFYEERKKPKYDKIH